MKRAGNDFIGVYLNQIGNIPLLTHCEEMALAKRIGAARQKFFHELLTHGYLLQASIQLLEKVFAGKIRIDRVIDVALTNLREKAEIRKMLGPNLRTVASLARRNRLDFALATSFRRSESVQRQARRRLIRQRSKAATLVQELRLRPECLLPALKRFRQLGAEMEQVNQRLNHDGGYCDAPNDREMRKHLRALMRSVQETPATLPRRMTQLARLQKQHDDVRQTLARANLRLVVSIAQRHCHRGMSFLDLIQEGNAGLIRAVDKYDYRRGCRFSTYATWWIRQAMTRAIADESRVIRVPIHMVDKIRKVRWFSQQLAHQYGRTPTLEELAEAADISLPDAQIAVDMMSQPLSIEQPVDERDNKCLGDILRARIGDDPAYELAQRTLANRIDDSLAVLDHREREVIRLRYGLHDGYSYTLAEVGRIFAVSRERVRQIESLALRKLQHPNRARRLAEFVERRIPAPLAPVETGGPANGNAMAGPM
jgi:RNA polymerase primary sigma factor